MDNKMYMIVHQAENQYRHMIPDSAYWHAVHAVDIVPVAFENHILLQPVRTNMPMIFHTAKVNKFFSSVKCLILSFLHKR